MSGPRETVMGLVEQVRKYWGIIAGVSASHSSSVIALAPSLQA